MPQLEDEVAELGRRMRVAGEMYRSARLNDMPDSLCESLVLAWYHDQLDGVVWEPTASEGDE